MGIQPGPSRCLLRPGLTKSVLGSEVSYNDRYQPLTLISTKWLMFKVLVKKRDNYNKTQSGIFFFIIQSGKKKKKTNAAHVYRMNHLTAGKILKDKERNTHLVEGAVSLNNHPQ